VVDLGTLSAEERGAVQSDVWERLQRWRDRRLKQVHNSVPRDLLQRPTSHVERGSLELVRQAAAAEGVSMTEVVNRALRTYFARK
jgi:hypothetical protein